MKRLAALTLGVALVATACGGDDETNTGATDTTVPVVTSTTTAAPDDAADPAETTSSTTTTAAPTTTTTAQPAGDITQASVVLDTLARVVQPIDAVVAPNGEWWVAQRSGEILVMDPASGVTGDTAVSYTHLTLPTRDEV